MIKVLLVPNGSDSVNKLRILLENKGYAIQIETNPLIAGKLARQEKFDIVVMFAEIARPEDIDIFKEFQSAENTAFTILISTPN